jgi:hypothetical protein
MTPDRIIDTAKVVGIAGKCRSCGIGNGHRFLSNQIDPQG